jgi:thioredoxin-related protein
MKKLFYVLYIFLLLIACISQKPEKQDVRFINAAVASAKQANKLLILEFTSPACVSCTMLNKDIFLNEENKRFLNENFKIIQVSPSDSVYKSLINRFGFDNQSSVIFFDHNGNELDRTVNYDGNREAYMEFVRNVSQGKNLFSVVLAAYNKDTLDVHNCYLMAEKFRFRNMPANAITQYRKVLASDRNNKYGLNQDCLLKIEKARLMQINAYDLEILGSQ